MEMNMADIKLTLSQDKCISREVEHMMEQGGLYYPLNELPKERKQVRWVYFILRNRLVARAKVVEIEEFNEGQRRPILDYGGKDIWKPGPWVKCADMELPLRSKGFEGFRYIREDEQKRFEEAFAWPKE
jgi:hypothetical protein